MDKFNCTSKRICLNGNIIRESETIPFGNGQWLPMVPEPEETLYWWDFPWKANVELRDDFKYNRGSKYCVWKLIAGTTITHLPQQCLIYMAPGLASKIFRRRFCPQVIDFGSEYEEVLELFTEKMLGLNDDICNDKKDLLDKLFKETGFKGYHDDDNHDSLLNVEKDKPASKCKHFQVEDGWEIPFGNGEWLPLIPEPEVVRNLAYEENVYWNSFPWRYKRDVRSLFFRRPSTLQPYAVWKLQAGKAVTHLPEGCIVLMAPTLSSKFVGPPRLAPQVIDFGTDYESVLGFFTERMLGINDDVPVEKRGLLNKLFDETGYQRTFEIFDQSDNIVSDKFPI